MTCSVTCKDLPCGLSGVAYTSKSAALGSNKLQLQSKHGARLPALSADEYFYASLTDACGNSCTTVKVIAIADDEVTLDAPLAECFSSNSSLSYVINIQTIADVALQIGINVTDPLIYDCETRTLSVDCQKLKALIENCGD